MKNLQPTGTRLEEQNYPYGFRLKCTRYTWIEFKKGKGWRTGRQTTNPKSGDKLNAPKYSTYHDLHLLYIDPLTNHVEATGCSFRSDRAADALKFIAEVQALLTAEELTYIKDQILMHAIVSAKSTVIYCGADAQAVKEAAAPLLTMLRQPDYNFLEASQLYTKTEESLKGLKVEGFSPFRTVNYGSITDNPQFIPQDVKLSDHDKRAGLTEAQVMEQERSRRA